MMIGYNTIGSDAIGTTSASSQASLSCSLVSSSTTSASLTTTVKLVATLGAVVAIAASLSSGPASLSATLTANSSLAGALKTTSTLQSSFFGSSSMIANLSSAQVLPTFTPSAARTINVQATSPIFTGSKWWNLTDNKKPRGLKDPDAIIDITFDWSDWLNDIGVVTISNITFTLNGVSSIANFHDGTTATVFVSGGSAGVAATIACKIQTNTTPSRTDERTVYLDIADE